MMKEHPELAAKAGSANKSVRSRACTARPCDSTASRQYGKATHGLSVPLALVATRVNGLGFRTWN